MYCPKCGKRSDPKQKYCRSCGMHLPRVSELVSFHEEFSQPERPDNHPTVRRRTIIFVAAGLSILLFSFLLPRALLGYDSFLPIAISFFGWAVVVFGLAQTLLVKHGYIRVPDRPGKTEEGDTQPLLTDAAAETFRATVTEDTTELLKVDAPGRDKADAE